MSPDRLTKVENGTAAWESKLNELFERSSVLSGRQMALPYNDVRAAFLLDKGSLHAITGMPNAVSLVVFVGLPPRGTARLHPRSVRPAA